MGDQEPQQQRPGTSSSSSSPLSLPVHQAHTLLSTFSAFLTVAVHNILYYRRLYPQPTFLSARAFNLPVHQSRHPKVCAWVRDAVDAVAAQLATGDVSCVAVVIHAPFTTTTTTTTTAAPAKTKTTTTTRTTSGKSETEPRKHKPGAVLERWMFDVSRFPTWPGGAESMRAFDAATSRKGGAAATPQGDAEDANADADADPDLDLDDDLSAVPPADEAEAEAEAGTGDPDPAVAVNWADVDEQFRAVVRRMAHAGEKLGPLPTGCTFTVAVELKETGRPPIGHPQPWIPSEPSLQIPPAASNSNNNPTSSSSRIGRDLGGARTTALRSVEAGPLFFECWVEEGQAKELLGGRDKVTAGNNSSAEAPVLAPGVSSSTSSSILAKPAAPS